jgi:hypothetical protein
MHGKALTALAWLGNTLALAEVLCHRLSTMAQDKRAVQAAQTPAV